MLTDFMTYFDVTDVFSCSIKLHSPGCHLNGSNIVRTPHKRHNKVCNLLSLAHFHSMNVEYRQCKFIRTFFLLYQGKMMWNQK